VEETSDRGILGEDNFVHPVYAAGSRGWLTARIRCLRSSQRRSNDEFECPRAPISISTSGRRRSLRESTRREIRRSTMRIPRNAFSIPAEGKGDKIRDSLNGRTRMIRESKTVNAGRRDRAGRSEVRRVERETAREKEAAREGESLIYLRSRVHRVHALLGDGHATYHAPDEWARPRPVAARRLNSPARG